MRAAHYVVLTVLVLGLLVSPRQGSAAIVVLSIDESTSTLTLGSNFTVAGIGDFTATEQSAGSLVASYSGTMTIEVDDLRSETMNSYLPTFNHAGGAKAPLNSWKLPLSRIASRW